MHTLTYLSVHVSTYFISAHHQIRIQVFDIARPSSCYQSLSPQYLFYGQQVHRIIDWSQRHER